MDRQSPKISVIICCYTMERLKDIHEAVQSVLAQTLKPYEVIVAVDHNEALFQELKTGLPLEVKVVLNNGAGGAVATDNIGIVSSEGDVVAFMDDDAVAQEDWLRCLLRHYQDPLVVAVGGRLISAWDGSRPSWFPEELDWLVGGTYRGHPETRTQVRNLILCNMSVRKGVFQVAGLFAPDLGRSRNWGTGAEAEFFLRLRDKISSAVILYDPEALVHHKVPPQRTSLKYVVLRSFNEGFHKAKLTKSRSGLPQNPLSTESAYLRYLLFQSIPERLKRFWKAGSLGQLGTMMVSVVATGAGYTVGRVRG
jgi:glycosyltransferase involved in cell wall biosynthesis